ncbi:unnamed protein product [Lactuca virosa]|uniref:Uncharacterized protein n=1 Tax=Lactuca virosa TaxID=75947 RepID=A0AAU9PHE1_9ASTR|nr:unnamed protein product [Lactuca virosa]
MVLFAWRIGSFRALSSLGVRRMNAACVAAIVEGGKQAVREQVASRKFNPKEASAIVEQTQAIHASVKAFMEIYFTSYIFLGDMDLTGLRQLCCDLDLEENPLESSS